MKLCYVTDRRGLPGPASDRIRSVVERIVEAAAAGVDWIQVREKDLTARELADLVGAALGRLPASSVLLVNDRVDIALAAGAGGVHLGEHSLAVGDVKRLLAARGLGERFQVGVSTHSLPSALAAQDAGADYLFFGPVFPTPSKAAYGAPQGVERLREVCRRVPLPVLAIGGITAENARSCLSQGAAGIAAIRLFQEAPNLTALVRQLKDSESS